jgi:hypothetical protein
MISDPKQNRQDELAGRTSAMFLGSDSKETQQYYSPATLQVGKTLLFAIVSDWNARLCISQVGFGKHFA